MGTIIKIFRQPEQFEPHNTIAMELAGKV